MESRSELPTTRIVLDLVSGADPIRGHLRHGTGEPVPFHGWLELIQLLDERRAAGTGGSGPG